MFYFYWPTESKCWMRANIYYNKILSTQPKCYKRKKEKKRINVVTGKGGCLKAWKM